MPKPFLRQVPDESPEAACEGKEPFGLGSLAKAVARRRAGRGRPSVAYRCPHCPFWHIGGRVGD